MMSIHRFVDILRPKVKPPLAIVLGAPGECTLLDHLGSTARAATKWISILGIVFASRRAETDSAGRDICGRLGRSAFASVIYIAQKRSERSLKLDMVEQVSRSGGGTFYAVALRFLLCPRCSRRRLVRAHAAPADPSSVRRRDRPKRHG